MRQCLKRQAALLRQKVRHLHGVDSRNAVKQDLAASERFSVFGTGAGAADTHVSQTNC